MKKLLDPDTKLAKRVRSLTVRAGYLGIAPAGIKQRVVKVALPYGHATNTLRANTSRRWHINQLLILIFASFALAQPLAASSSILTALEIVEKTVAAGGEAWARPKTLQLRGHATFYARGENGQQIHVPNYKMWRVFPTESKAAHQANGRVRFDAFIGDKLFFQIAFDGQQSYAEFSPEAESEREAAKWENSFGFGILRFARDPAFTLTRLADDQIEGHPCYFVRVIDPSKNVTDFGIDQKDFAIRSVSFKTLRGFHQRIYSDFKWHQKPRFRQPTRMRLYYDGVKWTDVTWQEFVVNQPIDDAVFHLSKGTKP